MAASGRMGETRQETGHGEAYVELLLSYLDDRHALTGLKLVVDCAWGAAYELGPEVLRRAGADVVPIHAEPRGELINVECGALHPQQLAERVLADREAIGRRCAAYALELNRRAEALLNQFAGVALYPGAGTPGV
jgi:phosphoglucosamine mutase